VAVSGAHGLGLAAESRLVSVVDDDPSVLRSVRSLLLSSGFRVCTFESAEAFLAWPEHTETSCLVVDLNMPTMSGSELVARLRATHSGIPFVVLSAVADPEVTHRMMDMGAISCLRKPVPGLELLGAIRTAVQKPR
jgi:FixJ family two-component response regulator